ncbi:glutamate--cysteine ligase [Salsipaludibacter albus]|uniref:glutamate--cysteine ligase n=1 Tax=Salsipaludibacter albus TaxID=2849650 RepID=UPI001EE479FE|nr:glutamate--cysteine ligase [Salsipaludibacter albus]MBY5163717.1 glutamate--cysteine ligase [Salsipaludibacter albus]
MGQEIERTSFTNEDRQRYRNKVKANLAALHRMLEQDRFERERKLAGLEMEFYVVDHEGNPANANHELLSLLAHEDFQTELAQFNIEFNLAPHKLSGTVFREMEEELLTSFTFAQRRAGEIDANVVMIGILPSLNDLSIDEQTLSDAPRYRALNEQVLAARGEHVLIDIEGREHLRVEASSIIWEAAATSTQLHLQVSPEGFAPVWNAAQAIAGAQVAVGANSPFFLGHQLWHETRIAVFEQVVDTRTEELQAQGVRPRVWFGEDWINDVTDLFDENVRFFPALLPLLDDENPLEELDRGGVPHLGELNLHNGTIWRWNRPIYAVARGKPHLRVENRVLPAGPTMVDAMANAAFYYGLIRGLVEADKPISSQLSFSAAQSNFRAGAQFGLESNLYWPGVGEVPAPELILRTLLPIAHAGLDAWNVDRRDRDHYLGIIEHRCLRRMNGAIWQIDTFADLADEVPDPGKRLVALTNRYIDHMTSNEPVHTWPRRR